MAKLKRVPQELCEKTTDLIDAISLASNITEDPHVDSNLWIWSEDLPTNGGFLLPNSQIYKILKKESKEWIYLNNKWGRIEDGKVWRKWWKKIWGPDLTRRQTFPVANMCQQPLYPRERTIGKGG